MRKDIELLDESERQPALELLKEEMYEILLI